MIEIFLESVTKQFEYYKKLGDHTFTQLEDADIVWQFNPESNSIAIIVGHLNGNMLSRWTDFLTTDGEKEWRNREAEFEANIFTKEKMLECWEEGWKCLFSALATINMQNFESEIFIRNQSHTIQEAVHRQLAHYAYHVGQIVYLGRMRRASDWKSLSIAKGKSADFNTVKFAKGKHSGHFSDDLR